MADTMETGEAPEVVQTPNESPKDAATALEPTEESVKGQLKRLGVSDKQIEDLQNFNQRDKDKGLPDEARSKLFNVRLKGILNALKRGGKESGPKGVELSGLLAKDRVLLIDQTNQSFNTTAQVLENNLLQMQSKGVKTLLLPVSQETLVYLRDKARGQHPEVYKERIATGAIKPNDPDMPGMEELLDRIDSTIDSQTGKPIVEVRPLISNPNTRGDTNPNRSSDAWENNPNVEEDYPAQQIIRSFLEGNQIKGGAVAIMKDFKSYFGNREITAKQVSEGLNGWLNEMNMGGHLKVAEWNADGTLVETTSSQETPQIAA